MVAASEAVGLLRTEADGTLVGGRPRMPAQYQVTDPEEVAVETYVSGLEVPWAVEFAADGRLFVTERRGRIRVARDGTLDPVPWAELGEVRVGGEGGLMGLALHPEFDREPWVYVCYTYFDGGVANRITRIREREGRGAEEQVLLDGIPGARNHNGCRLKFGPDGKLYSTHGEIFARELAQDLESLGGKILRLNPDGSVPDDNPFGPESPVYSYGHRNPQGLAFHPESGDLYATEHGPSRELFGLRAYDEVNVIVAGGNYGWPRAVGAPRDAAFVDPILTYPDSPVPPGGATFYGSGLIPEWTGNFFFTALGARHLQRVVLDGEGRVVAIERLFQEAAFRGVFGRLRDVIEGPDGALYVATSNRDGRGTPAPDDDRILRVAPRSSTVEIRP